MRFPVIWELLFDRPISATEMVKLESYLHRVKEELTEIKFDWILAGQHYRVMLDDPSIVQRILKSNECALRLVGIECASRVDRDELQYYKRIEKSVRIRAVLDAEDCALIIEPANNALA